MIGLLHWQILNRFLHLARGNIPTVHEVQLFLKVLLSSKYFELPFLFFVLLRLVAIYLTIPT